ncbi:MAG TPA: transposase family protein, partial [Gammaproteobacteria bacterium]|nr:transposase family protein [Gammaproteobacteria bacterium]
MPITCWPSRITGKISPMISRPLTGRLFPLSTPLWTRVMDGSSSAAFAPPPRSTPISTSPMRVKPAGSNGGSHTERVFCVTDLSPEQAAPERLLALDRGHWSIENRLHWVRDVIFDEDRCQVRKGHGPQVLACLRNAVIGLLRRL